MLSGYQCVDPDISPPEPTVCSHQKLYFSWTPCESTAESSANRQVLTVECCGKSCVDVVQVRVSGFIPEFTESILARISSLMFSGRRRCGVVINLVEVEAEIAFEILLDSVGVSTVEVCRSIGARISSADPTAQLHRIFPFEFALPGFQLGCRALKSPKKGFVAMDENCIEFRSINGAVWRSINTRHSNLTVVS
ncbi:hypothetical protein TNCV_4004661 [Trichonephila clavipes]|nr:hypothetical protein TNCV_4004661 [Trichonephila clavipes]